MKKKKGYPLVIVNWDDAWASNRWSDSLPTDEEGIKVSNVGWMTQNDKRGITLIGAATSQQHVSSTFFIPRGMVRSVLRLPARYNVYG